MSKQLSSYKNLQKLKAVYITNTAITNLQLLQNTNYDPHLQNFNAFYRTYIPVHTKTNIFHGKFYVHIYINNLDGFFH